MGSHAEDASYSQSFTCHSEDEKPRKQTSRHYERSASLRSSPNVTLNSLKNIWSSSGEMPSFAEGGSVKSQAKKLANMGRDGDTELVHVNKDEEKLLKAYGGRGSINPRTGLREYGNESMAPSKTISRTSKTINYPSDQDDYDSWSATFGADLPDQKQGSCKEHAIIAILEDLVNNKGYSKENYRPKNAWDLSDFSKEISEIKDGGEEGWAAAADLMVEPVLFSDKIDGKTEGKLYEDYKKIHDNAYSTFPSARSLIDDMKDWVKKNVGEVDISKLTPEQASAITKYTKSQRFATPFGLSAKPLMPKSTEKILDSIAEQTRTNLPVFLSLSKQISEDEIANPSHAVVATKVFHSPSSDDLVKKANIADNLATHHMDKLDWHKANYYGQKNKVFRNMAKLGFKDAMILNDSNYRNECRMGSGRNGWYGVSPGKSVYNSFALGAMADASRDEVRDQESRYKFLREKIKNYGNSIFPYSLNFGKDSTNFTLVPPNEK